MSDLLQKITITITGMTAGWFAFVFVDQPLVPLYHNFFLFMVSWVLFYSFVDIAVQPLSLADSNTQVKKKIRRKNKATLEKG